MTDPTASTPTAVPRTDVAIEVTGLTPVVRQGRGAHRDRPRIDLGECFALLGPNGAGKTTTARSSRATGAATAARSRCSASTRARRRAVARAAGHRAAAGTRPGDLTVAESVRHFAGYYPDPRDVDEVIDRGGPRREAQGARQHAVGRPAPPARRRARHRRPPGAAVPGRADHRLRPAGPARLLGADRAAEGRRHHDPADHPLPGGGQPLADRVAVIAGGPGARRATPRTRSAAAAARRRASAGSRAGGRTSCTPPSRPGSVQELGRPVRRRGARARRGTPDASRTSTCS